YDSRTTCSLPSFIQAEDGIRERNVTGVQTCALPIYCCRTWRGSQRGHERDEAARIGAALTSVAARLRAGQSPTEAWRAAAKQLPTGAARELEALVGGPAADPGARAGAGRGQVSGALHAAQAATALADDLGAELAPVLETCAAGIEESARAEAERTAAF